MKIFYSAVSVPLDMQNKLTEKHTKEICHLMLMMFKSKICSNGQSRKFFNIN